MQIHHLAAVNRSRLAGSLGLSLALPFALALCIPARPYLGFREPVSEAAGLGRNMPGAPLAEVDPIRIFCAWKEYRLLTNYRRSLPESRRIRETRPQYEDDYRCVYQEITPEGRRQACLPVPASEYSSHQ